MLKLIALTGAALVLAGCSSPAPEPVAMSAQESAFYASIDILEVNMPGMMSDLCREAEVNIDAVWLGFEPAYENNAGFNIERAWFDNMISDRC